MTKSSQGDVTQLLEQWSNGDQDALNKLMPLVYDELRRLARNRLRRERSDHTLQPTALVHEVYLRLAGHRDFRWQDRAHFFAVVAQSMRRVLTDHARGHNAAKRGGSELKVSLDEAIGLPGARNVDLIALDDALNRLALVDPQQSRIVELRFFGGLSIQETAEVLGISPATIKRDWVVSKAWLYGEIKKGGKTETDD